MPGRYEIMYAIQGVMSMSYIEGIREDGTFSMCPEHSYAAGRCAPLMWRSKALANKVLKEFIRTKPHMQGNWTLAPIKVRVYKEHWNSPAIGADYDSSNK